MQTRGGGAWNLKIKLMEGILVREITFRIRNVLCNIFPKIKKAKIKIIFFLFYFSSFIFTFFHHFNNLKIRNFEKPGEIFDKQYKNQEKTGNQEKNLKNQEKTGKQEVWEAWVQYDVSGVTQFMKSA